MKAIQPFDEWIEEKYPDWRPVDFKDLRYEWLQMAVDELIKRLATLEPVPPATTETAIVWPPSPLICKCGHFESDDIVCIHCGGLLF